MRSSLSNALALTLAALFASTAYGGYPGIPGGGMTGRKAGKVMLSWKVMYGVGGPFLGPAHALRGVAGDELPWEIEKFAKGSLTTGGHLTINVKGLVFPEDDPSVPPELRGINDEEEFRALVSCVTVDGDAVVETNVVTAGFPANMHGDSRINAWLDLPNPCIAPVVMVLAGSEDKWFASTGVIDLPGDAN